MRSETLERPSPSSPRGNTARRRGIVLLLPALLALPLCAAGCAPRKSPRSPRVSVTVGRAEVRAMPFAIVATGTIEPTETAGVGSQAGGVVTRIAFREGQQVQAGQVLIELDARPFRAAFEQAQANLARSQAQREVTRLEAARAARLREQGLNSQADYDQRRAAAAVAEAAARADSAAVATARLNLDFASIRAPISGRTGRLDVHVGDLVKAGTSEPLVTINRLRPILVRFSLPQSDLPLIQRWRGANPKVIVRPSPDDPATLEGRLAFVDNAVDPATGTLLLKGELPNADGRLWPGESVEVRLVLYVEPSALVVPAPAVTAGPQGTYVYVLNADSTVTPRPVTVTRAEDEQAIIARGLRAGETVVTDGQFRLAPGAKVLVRKAPQDSTAGARP